MPLSPTSAVTDEQLSRTYREAGDRLDRLAQAGLSWSGHERNCSYLNLGGEQFANVSAVSGFDFADDGRALAIVDWDFDGDLDVWVMNRTGPRLRYLQNEVQRRPQYLSLGLRGVTANRDAIGTRVILTTRKKAERHTQMRSLRAGEGFLGQCSKRIHFGLPADEEIETLVVQWPGGAPQTFRDVEPNRHYLAVEGEEELRKWHPPEVNPRSQVVTHETPPADDSVHNFLAAPVALPNLEYQTLAGETRHVSEDGGTPLLLSLWATWCVPCANELATLAQEYDQLRSAKVKVLALSTDMLAESPVTPLAVSDFAEKLRLPFPVGLATASTVEKLQVVDQYLFRPHRPLPLPCSVLIDSDGQLAAVYRGAVTASRVLSDVAHLAESPEGRLAASLPFAGRWVREPIVHPRLLTLAARLVEQGMVDETLAFSDQYRSELETDSGYPALLHRLGRELLARGQSSAAIDLFRRAVEVDPDDADGHFNLGFALSKAGQKSEAVAQYEESLRVNPMHVRTINNLAIEYLAQQRVDDAEKLYLEALDVNPKLADVHYNLAKLYRLRDDEEQARKHLALTIQLDPGHSLAHLELGTLAAARGNAVEMEANLRRAMQADPRNADVWFQLGNLEATQRNVRAAIENYQRAIHLRSEFAPAHGNLGRIYSQLGEEQQAAHHFRISLEQQPNQPTTAIALAWLLATGKSNAETAAEAFRLADQVNRMTGDQNPQVLDVLAATQAAMGQYPEAARTAARSVQLFSALGRDQEASVVRQRQRVYESGRPYRREATATIE